MNDFDVSICCLSFSKADGGNLLVAVDETSEHIISVWDWQKGENGYKITETKVRLIVFRKKNESICSTFSVPWIQ